jgi:hypothetical protein
MNQFESEAVRLVAGLFLAFCLAFSLLRNRLPFWNSLPRVVMVACLAWFVCGLIVIFTLRTAFFQGPVFMFAYFAAVMMTPPLLAAGFFESIVGFYVLQSPSRRFRRSRISWQRFQ